MGEPTAPLSALTGLDSPTAVNSREAGDMATQATPATKAKQRARKSDVSSNGELERDSLLLRETPRQSRESLSSPSPHRKRQRIQGDR